MKSLSALTTSLLNMPSVRLLTRARQFLNRHRLKPVLRSVEAFFEQPAITTMQQKAGSPQQRPEPVGANGEDSNRTSVSDVVGGFAETTLQHLVDAGNLGAAELQPAHADGIQVAAVPRCPHNPAGRMCRPQ